MVNKNHKENHVPFTQWTQVPPNLGVCLTTLLWISRDEYIRGGKCFSGLEFQKYF